MPFEHENPAPLRAPPPGTPDLVALARRSTYRAGCEPFRVEVHARRQVVHVVPIGELDIATAGQLDTQLRELGDAGFGELVLDLGQLTFIASDGAHLLLEADRRARQAGSRLRILRGGATIDRLLALTGVDRQLEFAGQPSAVRKDVAA